MPFGPGSAARNQTRSPRASTLASSRRPSAIGRCRPSAHGPPEARPRRTASRQTEPSAAPRHDNEHDVRAGRSASAAAHRGRLAAAIVIRAVAAAVDRDVEDGARARCGAERSRDLPPPADEAPLERGHDRARSIAGSSRSSTYACEIRPPPKPAITAGAPATPQSARSRRGDRDRRGDAAQHPHQRASSRSIDRLSRGGVGVGPAIKQRALDSGPLARARAGANVSRFVARVSDVGRPGH